MILVFQHLNLILVGFLQIYKMKDKSNTILSLFGYSVIPLALLLGALLIIQYEGSISPMPNNVEIVLDGRTLYSQGE